MKEKCHRRFGGFNFDRLFLIYILLLICKNGLTKYRANYFEVFSQNYYTGMKNVVLLNLFRKIHLFKNVLNFLKLRLSEEDWNILYSYKVSSTNQAEPFIF